MKYDRMNILPVAVLLAAVLWPSASRAETYFDLYGGQAWTGATSLTVAFQPYFAPTVTATRQVEFDASGEGGIRAVIWSAQEPGQGFGIGFSRFEASGPDFTIDVNAYSFSYMGRLRLRADQWMPSGRLQPYLGLGVVVLDATGQFDFSPEFSRRVGARGDASGADLRLGIRWLVNLNGSLLAEVRYTSAEPDMESLTWGNGKVTAGAKLETTHLYLGFSLTY